MPLLWRWLIESTRAGVEMPTLPDAATSRLQVRREQGAVPYEKAAQTRVPELSRVIRQEFAGRIRVFEGLERALRRFQEGGEKGAVHSHTGR